ncbi:hypothetical protein [Thermostichus vulcanus]|uniref:Uncharacterized protein n=1 Tax=Thermostichus vulcanus str. 'Rupite' TaxID=2813851 RepID=A0ABT0C831_THEVL|nr:hypothetical protein [Thermostichus vulcanus]MCJ2541953.1 hypothetical protein [Thermostichus vulcanus str. 'Rupite']
MNQGQAEDSTVTGIQGSVLPEVSEQQNRAITYLMSITALCAKGTLARPLVT